MGSIQQSPSSDSSINSQRSDTEESDKNNDKDPNSQNQNYLSPQASTSSQNAVTRKRKSNPMNWRSNKLKYLRNTGQAYQIKNKTIRAKRLRSPCNDQCRLQCPKKLTEDQRKQCFEEYWGFGDLIRQRNYLKERIEPIKRKYRYTTTEKGRRFNSAFYFYVMGQKIKVCKTFFLNTLDISSRVVRTVIDKVITTGDVIDLRGKHRKRLLPADMKDSIRDHIKSILRKKDKSRRKTKANMYNDYKRDCIKHQKPYGSYLLYTNILRTEFSHFDATDNINDDGNNA